MNLLADFLPTLIIQSSLRLAVVGYDGLVGVEDETNPNIIKTRLDGYNGKETEVRISAIHPNYGDVIYIIRENPGGLAGWRMVFWLRDASDATAPPPVTGSDRVRHGIVDADNVLIVDADGLFLEE